MDIQLLKDLVNILEKSEICELEVEEGNFRLRIAKPIAQAQNLLLSSDMIPTTPPIPAPAAQQNATAAQPVVTESAPTINSPMVGTFYRAPAPDAPPFVKIGDRVSEDTIICIIEAMKVMNELPAGVSGTITQILVENGQPIEYGQPLFQIKP